MKKLVLGLVVMLGCANAQDFTLSSPELEANGLTNKQMFNQFGCQGENISPALEWKNAPKDTKSFVLTVYDPDAPSGSGWWHWVVANISPATTGIIENAGSSVDLMPKGSWSVRNDYGINTFGGACPPEGRTHRYQFTLYALDIDQIPESEAASPALIGFMANHHAIGKATMTYTFGR